MRIFVVRVFIRKGALETDTFILTLRRRSLAISLAMLLIRLSRRSGRIMLRWVMVALRGISRRRILILRMSRGSSRA